MPQLLEQLTPEHRAAIEHVRDWLGANSHSRPKLEFTGIAWRWNERFDFDPLKGGAIRCVCIIPDPVQPRIAISCERDFFRQHPPSFIPKPLHAGLGDGVCVGSQAWCTWVVPGTELAKAIIELLTRLMAE